MAQATIAVGDPVQSRCTKCKCVTRHVVVSLVEEKPARVECVMCEGVHNYRAPGDTLAPKTARPARKIPVRRGSKAASTEQEFDAAMQDLDTSRARRYSMDATFRAGDVIAHPTFGLGLVRRVVPPQKIDVLFRDAIRRLRIAA